MICVMGLALAELAEPQAQDPCETRGPQPKPIAITSSVAVSPPRPTHSRWGVAKEEGAEGVVMETKLVIATGFG
jgi:hypothetical protein